MSQSFIHRDPESLQEAGATSLQLAEDLLRTEIKPEDAASLTANVAAAIHLTQAQVLDRLDRIILLLNERLPRQPRKVDLVDQGAGFVAVKEINNG